MLGTLQRERGHIHKDSDVEGLMVCLKKNKIKKMLFSRFVLHPIQCNIANDFFFLLVESF
jgi:hypothetical protein